MTATEEYKHLTAGVITAEYSSGTLRNISCGGSEIIRMFYAAVRDETWLNVPFEIVSEKLESCEAGFRILLSGIYKKDSVEFKADFSISGNEDNCIAFEFSGQAVNGFMKNRIGICVLHPPETCRGKSCLITHSDGTSESLNFPEFISPHQPFSDIRSMSWKFDDLHDATLKFEGDVFETEDQRNWTDASYKTYGTPLSAPFPVYVPGGTIISQKAVLQIRGKATRPVMKESKRIRFEISGNETIPLPPVGTSVSSRKELLTTHEAGLLRKTILSHLRAELHLFENYWPVQYERILHEHQLLGWPLDLCLLFGKDHRAETDRFLNRFKSDSFTIRNILILSAFHKSTPPEILADVLPVLKNTFPGIPVGAGTNCNLAELNRSAPAPHRADFISFAIHPREHASDDRTMFENTTAQMDAVASAKRIAGHRPVHISPVTLQRRFNANVTTYERLETGIVSAETQDPRQDDLFAAAWTAGSLKSIISAGASSITYFETAGKRGILDGGRTFPVYSIFSNLLPGYKLIQSESSKPLTVQGLVFTGDKHGLTILANFTRQKHEVYCMGSAKIRMPGQVILLDPYETRILQF